MKKDWEYGNLRVMENGRYFANGDKAFFLLADTAWTLFQKLDEKQALIYLRNRKEKGFNTIFAVLVNFQSNKKTAFDLKGDRDILEIMSDSTYWDNIKNVIAIAEDLGLYMDLLPVCGNVVKNKWLRDDNVEAYINFITEQLGQFKNIIWIAGGDCRGDVDRSVWETIGNLLKQQTPDKLIGFHPFGRTSSSYWFQDANWLDFHMFQSGHRRSDQRNLNAWDESVNKDPWYGEENFRYVIGDYAKTPPRPVMDCEPSYEQIPQGLHNPDEPYWQDHHIRRYAYWSVCAGSAGHVYGHNAIIQFYGTGGEAVYGVKETWEKSIHDIGSAHMKFLKELMEESDFTNCKAMQDILTDPAGKVQEDNLLAFGNLKRILCYTYNGRKISFNDKIDGLYDDYWFGSQSYFGSYQLNNTIFTPPDKKNGWNDWVLVLKKLV